MSTLAMARKMKSSSNPAIKRAITPSDKRKTGSNSSGRRRSFRGIAPEARKQLRRGQLIEAGIEAFGHRGFHAVTVREICAGAQLTERYFYESFSGLDALFNSVYRQLNEELRRATIEVLANQTRQPMELAEAALGVFFEYVRRDPRRARIMLIEAVSMGHDSRRIAEEATRGFMILIRDFADQLMPQSRSFGIDVDLLAAGLVGANIHVATRWLREQFSTPLEQVLFTITTMYRTLILHMGDEAQRLTGELKANRKSRPKLKPKAQARSPRTAAKPSKR
jgi:AcrR family transcriptional regulator